MTTDRRTFLAGSAALALSGCAGASAPARGPSSGPGAPPGGAPLADRPTDWDPVAYNLKRGEAGFIPAAYLAQIQAPDGIAQHLGKHLPFVPPLAESRRVPGMLPLMFGDPNKAHARHPNAPKTAENPEGHWYDWIRVAIAGRPETEVETRFDGWPACTEAVNGKLVGFEDPDPAADAGKNTVYLVELPTEAKSGDLLRIWGHCLTHGEYVEFLPLA